MQDLVACLPIFTSSSTGPHTSLPLMAFCFAPSPSPDPSKRRKQRLPSLPPWPSPSLCLLPSPSAPPPAPHPFPIQHGVTLSLCLSPCLPPSLPRPSVHGARLLARWLACCGPLSPSTGRNRRMTQTRVVPSCPLCLWAERATASVLMAAAGRTGEPSAFHFVRSSKQAAPRTTVRPIRSLPTALRLPVYRLGFLSCAHACFRCKISRAPMTFHPLPSFPISSEDEECSFLVVEKFLRGNK